MAGEPPSTSSSSAAERSLPQRHWQWCCAGLVPAAALAVGFALQLPAPDVEVAATDRAFRYEGRWLSVEGIKRADWSCSGIRFQVEVTSPAGSAFHLLWHGVRTRVKFTVHNDESLVSSWEAQGPWLPLPWAVSAESVSLPAAGNYTVSVRKLNSPRPFGTGIGSWLLAASVLDFHGLSRSDGELTLKKPPRASRLVEFIGAGDAAGYCADGAFDLPDAAAASTAWQLENCDSAYPGLLGHALGAEIRVQALQGIGVVQNAFFQVQPYRFGQQTMRHYWSRMLQSAPESERRKHPKPWPDLVVIDLGGNDFSHQGGHHPQEYTFRAVYGKLLEMVFGAYDGFGSGLKVAVVCGMSGDLPEAKRCAACRHVQDAVDHFNEHLDRLTDHESVRVEYVDIPCDGSVVGGTEHLGCLGHKNREGQLRIAQSLEPKLRSLMGWN